MVLIEGASKLLLAPFRTCKHVLSSRAVRACTFRATRSDRFSPMRSYSLPVIEKGQLASLYFAIEQATVDDEGYDNPKAVPDIWLRCIVAGQYFTDRLLLDLQSVEYHMEFWKERLRTGNNTLFLAVARGPVQFIKAIKAFFNRLRGKPPPIALKPTHRIEQRIVTLRTMRNALTAIYARLHEAGAHLRIAPEFKDGEGSDDNGDDLNLNPSGPVEAVEGSTARAVASAVEMYSAELLDAVRQLRSLQAQLDEQQEGEVTVKVSEQPVLFALTSIGETPIPATLPDTALENVPRSVLLASQRLHDFLGSLHAQDVRLDWRANPIAGVRLLSMKHASSMADSEPGHILLIPHFVRAPSMAQRYWMRNTLNTALTIFVLRFLVINSPLCGSKNLQNWIVGGYLKTLRGFRDNVMRPLSKVKDEFFETFSARASYSTFSRSDFEASKESLQRMLDAFERDVASKDSSYKAGASGMEVLLRQYERELEAPLRNAITGKLPRALLIQVHKMKTDTEAAMVELDQIMKANELTMAVTAALPSMLVAGLCSWALYRVLAPPPPNMRTTAGPVRVAMAALEQDIDKAVAAEAAVATAGPDATAGMRAVTQRRAGSVLVSLAKLRAVAAGVYRMSSRSISGAGDGSSWAREWKHLDRDLLEMAAAGGDAQRQARIASRVHRSYLVFRT